MLAEATTEDAIAYAQPNGRLTAELSSGPARTPDPSSPDGWAPIDTTLVSDAEGVHPETADADIQLSDGGTEPSVVVTDEGTTVGMEWDGPLPEPTLDRDSATYHEVLPGTDLNVTVQPSGFEVSLIVNAPPAEALVLYIPLITGDLTPSLDSSGRLSLTGPEGTEVASADPAVMWDASLDEANEPVHEQVVPTELVSTTDGYALRLMPDPAFFQAAGLQYPVTVDPTTTLFSPSTDTHVRSDTPTTTYGSSTVLKAGTPDGPKRLSVIDRVRRHQRAGEPADPVSDAQPASDLRLHLHPQRGGRLRRH